MVAAVLLYATTDHIRILGIELKLPCNGGSCEGKSFIKIFACEKIVPHEPRLQASSSSIPRILILSVGHPYDVINIQYGDARLPEVRAIRFLRGGGDLFCVRYFFPSALFISFFLPKLGCRVLLKSLFFNSLI